jgi:hypothetical protein
VVYCGSRACTISEAKRLSPPIRFGIFDVDLHVGEAAEAGIQGQATGAAISGSGDDAGTSRRGCNAEEHLMQGVV